MILYKPWLTLLFMCQIVRSKPAHFTPKSHITDFDYYYDYESAYNYTDYLYTEITDSFTQCLRDLENVDLEFIEPDTLKNVDVDDVAPPLGLTFFGCLPPTHISPVKAPENSPIYSYGRGFQGDIMFRSKEEYCRIISPPTTSNTTGHHHGFRRKRQIPDNTMLPNKWPNKVIPLRFAKNITSAHMDVIGMAMAEIESKTCLKFLEDPLKRYEPYVHIIEGPDTERGQGCFTYVGYVPGRSQKVNLGPNCFSTATVVHELMHVAGFYHTHARKDRDQYVDIHEENIKEDKKNQIVPFTDSTMMDLNIPYDFTSVMHYYWYAFRTDRAKDNNWATITKKGDNPRQPNDKIHDQPKTGLSELDVEGLRKLYECEPKLADCPKGCANGQCVGPNDCRCRSGYKGETCNTPDCPKGCANGQCVGPNDCRCRSGYKGETCNTQTCKALHCKYTEMCVEGYGDKSATCVCKPGTGDHLGSYMPPRNC